MEIKVSDISDRLSAIAPQVARFLLPGGKEYGQEWLCGDLSGGPGESLKVRIHSTYAGQWRDWAAGDEAKGDLIDLWRMVKGLTQAEAIKEAKAYLGIIDPVRQQEAKQYAKPAEVKTAPLNHAGDAMKYLTTIRGLKREIVEALKIEGSVAHKAIVFPCFSPSGILINRSYRTLGEKKKVWQDTGCAPCLFGWHALPEAAYKARKVLLSEGQIDCASWLQWGIPALSIPNGSGCSWIDYEWDNLAAFDTIYLAFDQDAAGQTIAEKVMSRLGKHRCMLVSMPKKDANACLQSGYSSEDAADWIVNAKAPGVNKFLTAKELEARTLESLRDKGEAFTLEFFKEKWPERGFYLRPGEVTCWTGYSFSGKSTILNFMESVLIAENEPVFVASMEMLPEVLLKKLITIFYGERISAPIVKEFISNAGHLLLFADVVGYITQDMLFEMLWFAYRRFGAKHYIIDSLMRIEGLEEDYPKQGEFCNRLQEFAKQSQTHVHLVAHLSKPTDKSIKAKPSMYGIKGSSLIPNNVDNIAIVCRNQEKDRLKKENRLTKEQADGMHDTEVIIEKQRDSGWVGSFRLKFNSSRFSFSRL